MRIGYKYNIKACILFEKMQCHEIYNINIRFNKVKKSSKYFILTRFFLSIFAIC